MEGSEAGPFKTGLDTEENNEIALLPAHAAAWARLDQGFAGSSFSLTKERIQCICEGGHQCECEDPDCQKTENAFPGLHSNWITHQVLAMARPWQCNMSSHHIPEAFQAAGIGMVVNLQEVGEHAHCGKGNLPHTGFSYDPESFMAVGIGVYNFSWRDMGVPNLHKMLDIVQVMAYVTSVEKRKIAVHCHAGLGRTGLAIACCLVFLGSHSAQAAITLVRQCRPGSLQTHQQEHFVATFEAYIAHLRCTFKAVQDVKSVSHVSQPMEITADARGTQQAYSTLQLPDLSTNAQHSAILVAAPTIQASAVSTPQSVSQLNSFSTADEARAVSGARRRRSSAGQSAHHLLSRFAWSSTPEATDSDLIHTTGSNSCLPWTTDGAVRTASMFGRAHVIIIEPPACLQEALVRQHRLLHGEERRALGHLPKCVDAVATALEAAAQMRSSGSMQPRAADGSQPANSTDTVTKSVVLNSVLSEMAAFAGQTCSSDDTRASSAEIALQVNQGKWISVSAAPVATVMQLLQMWLQSFQEPILSVPLQQAIAALLYPVPCSLGPESLCSTTGSTADAATCIPNQDITVYNAVVQLLTVQQRAVIARLASCVQTVRSGSPDSTSLESHAHAVLQWLTLRLTGCSASNRATAAVLHMMERCIDDASVMHLLRSTRLPDTALTSDGQHSTPGVTPTSFDAAQCSVLESQQVTACSLTKTLQGSSQTDSLNAHAPHVASSSDKSGRSQVKADSHQTARVAEAGCMRISSFLAKMIFAKAL